MGEGALKRTTLFASLLVASLAAFLVTAVWYLSEYQSGSGSLSGMMGQMMGRSGTNGMNSAMPYYVWYPLIAFPVLAILGAIGLVYFLAYPEIPRLHAQPAPYPAPTAASAQSATVSARPETAQTWDFLMRTSKPDEKKVLEVLAAHGGRYLQKFIVKESGLSKLKTHRIVSRFAERGIVTAVASGNTNEVALAPSLKPPSAKPP